MRFLSATFCLGDYSRASPMAPEASGAIKRAKSAAVGPLCWNDDWPAWSWSQLFADSRNASRRQPQWREGTNAPSQQLRMEHAAARFHFIRESRRRELRGDAA